MKFANVMSATLLVRCNASRRAVFFLQSLIALVFVIHVSTGSALNEISVLDKLASQILIYLGFEWFAERHEGTRVTVSVVAVQGSSRTQTVGQIEIIIWSEGCSLK
jgi:hypothetical protein